MEQVNKIQVQPGQSAPTQRSMRELKGSDWLKAMKGWMRTFARHYPRAADNPWGPEDLEIYARGLQDLSLADLNGKCEVAMKTCGSFAPTIGQILEARPAERPATKPPDCEVCHGTGWRPADPMNLSGPVRRCECRA